jgi:hypothetical protein
MEENVITGIVIAGNIYNVIANGVKCPQCAVKDLCLRGKLGSKVQFDCASVHLEKSKLIMNKDKNKLDSPPNIITLSDDVLNDIYSDMQADQALMLEQSGIYE